MKTNFRVRCSTFDVLLGLLLFPGVAGTGSAQPVIAQQPQSQTSDAGDYLVVLTNVQGAVNSVVAHLYVTLPPILQFAASGYVVAENRGCGANRADLGWL